MNNMKRMNQMNPMNKMEQQPMQDMQDTQEQEPSLTIEIDCMPDGTFTVEAETGGQEQTEEGGEGENEGEETKPQVAKSWDEAISIATQLYQQESGNNEQSKQAGFDQVFKQ